MFHGLSSNSRHLSCTEDPGIYTSISWGGKAGGESSHIFFPCFQQEFVALKLHLTNHHYRLRNLQGFLNIVGLLETKSGDCSNMSRKEVFISSGWTEGQCWREGCKYPLSSQSGRQERQLDSAIFHCSDFSALFQGLCM